MSTICEPCAIDPVGILGALGADGRIVTKSPESGASLEVEFRGGQPLDPGTLVIFLVDRTPCGSVVDEMCPQINVFENPASAARWIDHQPAQGTVVPLVAATAQAAAIWRPLIGVPT